MCARLKQGWAVVGAFLLAVMLTGCATTKKIDWTGRVGHYTFDQAVIDYGPPDKQIKLSDESTVAEWTTKRGRTYAYAPAPFYGYYPWGYGPYYSPFLDTYTTPDYLLRLVFGTDGLLKDFRRATR